MAKRRTTVEIEVLDITAEPQSGYAFLSDGWCSIFAM
jgi:hypothetical protein